MSHKWYDDYKRDPFDFYDEKLGEHAFDIHKYKQKTDDSFDMIVALNNEFRRQIDNLKWRVTMLESKKNKEK